MLLVVLVLLLLLSCVAVGVSVGVVILCLLVCCRCCCCLGLLLFPVFAVVGSGVAVLLLLPTVAVPRFRCWRWCCDYNDAAVATDTHQ